MGSQSELDAVVVGAGPNGLAAAITLAAAGRSVHVVEAAPTVGGGTRSAELTLPGFVHDVCSAVHPLAAISPFLASRPLARHGLELVHPEIALAHPLDGGRAGLLYRSLDATVTGLDAEDPGDGQRWRRLLAPIVDGWDDLAAHVLGPVLRLPRHPIAMARFGIRALPPVTRSVRRFRGDAAPAVFSGCGAHAFLPLERLLTSSFAVMLAASGHVAGWPFVRGGTQALADALAADLRELGGTIEVGRRVGDLAELPPSRAVLLDVTPRQVLGLAGDRLPDRYRRRLRRFRYGPGAFKIDYALSEPVPWTNPGARLAGTLHLGGTIAEVATAEREVAAGRCPEHPFVLVAQPTIVDPSRAPAGRHVLWTYCHVPQGFSSDPATVVDAIEAQIERFAPGFRDVVLARHIADPAWFEAHNENYVGGDIAGGSHAGLQLLFRPTVGLRPYRTPDPTLFLCSASTPPGGGVHGMCGHHAATAALATILR